MDTDNNDQNLLNVDANTSSVDMSVLEVSASQDDTLSYQTADEENSSKYFSMIEGDSTLEGSCSVNVTLDSKTDLNTSSIVESESGGKPSQVLNSLANLTIESVNKLHIHERIDAANILSGGVDIFDDNENSLDEHELVIDDDAHPSEKSNDYLENSAEVSGDMGYKGGNPETAGEEKETETNFNKHFELFKKSGDEEIVSEEAAKSVAAVVSKEGCEVPKKEVAEEIQEVEVKTDNYSALLQSNLPEGSSEVTLVIDDKNTEAIDIGEGVFIYKRDDGELTAIQITMNEDGVTNFKCLHVGKNEDGNLEVYEEQVNQVPVTNEELESMKAKELSNADETMNIQSVGEVQLKDSSIVSETVETQRLGEVQLKAISLVSETADLRITEEVQPEDISIVSDIVNIQSTEVQLKDISIVNETVDILQNTEEEVQPKDVSVNETVDIFQNPEEIQLKDISIVNQTVDILQSSEEEQHKDIVIETVDVQSTEGVQLKDISIVNEIVDIQSTGEVQLKDICTVNETTNDIQITEEVQLKGKDISIVNETVDIQSTGKVQLKDICTVNETTEDIQIMEEVQLKGKDISIVNETTDIQCTEEAQLKETSTDNETMDIQSTEEVQLKETSNVNETTDIQCPEEAQLKETSTDNETMHIQSTEEVQLKETSNVNETTGIQCTEEAQLKETSTDNETMHIQSTEEVQLKDISTINETMEELQLKDNSTVNKTTDIQSAEELQLKDFSVDIQSTEEEQLKDITNVIETADSQITEEVQLKEISQDKMEVSKYGDIPELLTVSENANSECEVEAAAENVIVNLAFPACGVVLDKSDVHSAIARIDKTAEEDVIENATAPSISIPTIIENLNSSTEVKTILEHCLEVQLAKDENALGSSCDVSSDQDVIEETILTLDTKEELDHPKPTSVSEPAESTDLSPQYQTVAAENDLEDKIDIEDSENLIDSENEILQVSSPTKIPLSSVKINLPTEFISDSIENSDKLSIVECTTEANTSMAISEIIEVNDIDSVDSSSFNATSPLSPKFGIIPEVECSKNEVVVLLEVAEGSDEPNLKQDLVPEEVITLGTICNDDSKLLSSSELEPHPIVTIESSSEPSVPDLVMGPEEWLEPEEPEVKLIVATIPENKPVEVMEVDEDSSEPNIIELSDDDSADTQIETIESAPVNNSQVGLTEKVLSEMPESSIEAKNKSIDIENFSNIPSFSDIVSTDKISCIGSQNQNMEKGMSPISPNEIPVLQISDTSDSEDTIEISLADKPTIQSIIMENHSVKIISVITEEEPEKNQKSSKKIECSDSMKLSSESNLKNSLMDTSPLKAIRSQSSVESEDDPEDDDYVEGEPVTGDSGVDWIAANSSQCETFNVNTATTLEKPTVQHTADLKLGESSGETNYMCVVDKGVAAPSTENQEVSDNNNDISVDGLPVKKAIDLKAIQSIEKNVVSEVDFDKFVRRNSIPLLEECNSIEFENVSHTVKIMSVPVLEEECEIVEISTLPVKEMPLPTLSNNGVKIASNVTTQPSQREVVVNKKAFSPREVSTFKPTLPQLYRSPVKEKSNYSKNLSPPPVQSAHKQIIPNKSALLQKGDVKILTKYTESPSQPFTNVSKLRTYSPSHKLNFNQKPASIQNRPQQNAFREVDKARVVQGISSPRPHQLLVQANSTIVANVSLVGHTITDHKDKSPGANRHIIMHHKNNSPVANRDTITDRKDKSPGTNLNIILDNKNKSPGINRNTIVDQKDKSPGVARNTITDHKNKSPVANIEKTNATNIINVKIPTDTETISSAEDSPNSEQKPQAKCRQPRKQVFTPVTRSDMEIIFPNLYSNAEEYKKESEAKALKMTYKLKERDIRFKQLSKKDPAKNILDKSPKTSPNTTLSPGSKPVTNIDLSLSPERESKIQKTPDILKSDSTSQPEVMNIDNRVSNSPLSSSAKRKRGRPKKNQTISTDVLKSDEDSPLLPNEKSDITVTDVPEQLVGSPVKKIEKAKELTVTEVMKTKITPIKEGTDPKEISVKEVTNAKETLVQEVTEVKETPVQEVTEEKVTPVKDVSQTKESSAEEVSKVKDASVEEVSKAKETSVNEIINVKENPLKEITMVKEPPAKEVTKTKETVEESMRSKENLAKEVTRTKQTLEKGAALSKESPLREVTKPKESPLQEASKSENSPRTNPISPFGKINDNIKCPMCFKTFRTENVLLKHVKHCNGIIDIETIKSPRKRKITSETPKDDLSCSTPEKKATEPMTQGYDSTLKITATKGAKPEIISDISEKIETKLNPSLSDNLPKKRGRKPKVAVLNDEISENKATKPGALDMHADPKKPVKCENIPEKKGLQHYIESPKIKSIEPANDPSFEVLHQKETLELSDKAIISFNQHRRNNKELPNELSPERKKVMSDDSGNDSVIIMESDKTMPPKSPLETISIEDSFSSSPLNHKFENNVVNKSVERVEASLGTVKEKKESKMVLPAKRDTGEQNNLTEIAKNISDKASKEKTIGGSKKLLPTAMESPMSRLAKMKNTKPVVNSPIVCEICGKTFRQLAHMVYHRTKHTVDEPEPNPISSVETPKATTPKKPVVTEEQAENSVEPETMLKCEICQKGFRKLHHLVEHRELHTNSESRSRRTSVASVKSEAESAGFRCDTCDKSFRKLHHLVEHRELHIAEALQSLPQPAVEAKPMEDATCSGCGKSFRKRHHMVEHRDIHCSPSKKGKPDDSSNDNNIRLSVASSTSEDGNNCGICGKSYRKLHHMVEHRESHIEVREEKSTNLPEVLNTKDIIHECSRCYMVFPNENSLNKHVIICSRKKLLNKSKSVQQEMMHLIDDVDVFPLVPISTQCEEGVSESSGTASKLEPGITEPSGTSKLESFNTHAPDNNQLKKSNDVSDQNIGAKDQDVEVSVSATPAALNANVPVPPNNERAPPNRPGRRSLFSNDILRMPVSKRKSLNVDPVSSKTQEFASVPTNLNAGVQRPLRKPLVARSQESSKIEESEKRLYTFRNLRKSTSSVDTVTSRTSSRRSINSTTSIDSKDPIRKTISCKDPTASKLKIPLRKSLVSGIPAKSSSINAKPLAPVKTTSKVAVRKSSIRSKDDEPNVKYMIKEPIHITEPQPKYKINPEFNKPNRRLSQPLAPKNVTKTIIKPRKRVSESALSGLKLPSAKMLKAIVEESDIRYSFPKSPKLKSESTDHSAVPSTSSSSTKKPVSAKVSKLLPKMNENAKKTKKVISSVLMSQKRKSLGGGGRNSVEGRKLPGLAKKTAATLQLRCCQQVFTSQANLSVHRKTHKVVRQAHKCDCGKAFDTEGLLKRHIHTEHTPPKSFKCTDCGASVRTAAQFAKHKKDHQSHPPKANASNKVMKTTTKLQTESAPKIRDTKKIPAKTEEVGAKKGVKRKIAHGGVPLSDKMRKAMAGVKF